VVIRDGYRDDLAGGMFAEAGIEVKQA